MSTRIAARLTETEDALRHIETVVASGPPDELLALQTLGANIDNAWRTSRKRLGAPRGWSPTARSMKCRLTSRLGLPKQKVRFGGSKVWLPADRPKSSSRSRRSAPISTNVWRTSRKRLGAPRAGHRPHAPSGVGPHRGSAHRNRKCGSADRRSGCQRSGRRALGPGRRCFCAHRRCPSANRGGVGKQIRRPLDQSRRRRSRGSSASCQHHDRASDAAGWSRRLGAAAALTGAVALESLNSGSQTPWSGADCQTRRSDSRTGRRADRCRSNASSHQRRGTNPTPTRRTTARRDGRRTGAARAGSTGKTHPTNKSVDAADDTWSFRTGTGAPRRCPDNGGRDCSFRRACPICRGSFDYLDTTRREGVSQRARGGHHTPDPSRATSRVGCVTDRQRWIRTVVRLRSDTCRTGHERRSDAAGQSSAVASTRRPLGYFFGLNASLTCFSMLL